MRRIAQNCARIALTCSAMNGISRRDRAACALTKSAFASPIAYDTNRGPDQSSHLER